MCLRCCPRPFASSRTVRAAFPPTSTFFACGAGARPAVASAHCEKKGQICLWAGLACPAKACQPSLPNEAEDEMAGGRAGGLQSPSLLSECDRSSGAPSRVGVLHAQSLFSTFCRLAQRLAPPRGKIFGVHGVVQRCADAVGHVVAQMPQRVAVQAKSPASRCICTAPGMLRA